MRPAPATPGRPSKQARSEPVEPGPKTEEPRANRKRTESGEGSAAALDPKLAYWTAAFANMTVLVGFAVAGIRHVRRGEVARHRRAMTIAAVLVVVFLVSYPLKVLFLGREDMDAWSPASVFTLRLHELCVMGMLLGGGLALMRGRRLARTRALLDTEEAPEATPESLAGHRRAGRTAVAAAVLAWASAGLVLAHMYGRS